MYNTPEGSWCLAQGRLLSGEVKILQNSISKAAKCLLEGFFSLLLQSDPWMYATDDAVKWVYIKVYFVNIQLQKSQWSYFSL